ncbi:hypothetical protein RSOLAG1IB_10944 [Rhizoctonia solani AG-1 IB]|uniref:Uncharacterized protein n=1 Tax=Thanatephorus cucumeris (strain AG1-IB / isolate 7/3/14) TaxID=1108050 RepID=M5C2D0_THACB|nr:hypothetical protein BN14_07231 [Rhizoctonia solani AG-1 IB]CEL63961.1 hypothetical protein RSOLAG1IB_10944 [Rhizoctonia solani AG-1 IB]
MWGSAFKTRTSRTKPPAPDQNTLDDSLGTTTVNQEGAQDIGDIEPPINPPPSETPRNHSAIDPASNTQAIFDFGAVDVHPAAPQWPTTMGSQPSTPKTRSIVLNGAGVQESLRLGPSTPQRHFRFVTSTPEQQAARANRPRRARSSSPVVALSPAVRQSPVVPRVRPVPRVPVLDFPLDPELVLARIDITGVVPK